MRCPLPTLEDVPAQDRLGALYKLLAGCLVGGILNVIYCRLFLKICSHLNIFDVRFLPPMVATFQKSLEITSLFYQLMLP